MYGGQFYCNRNHIKGWSVTYIFIHQTLLSSFWRKKHPKTKSFLIFVQFFFLLNLSIALALAFALTNFQSLIKEVGTENFEINLLFQASGTSKLPYYQHLDKRTNLKGTKYCFLGGAFSSRKFLAICFIQRMLMCFLIKYQIYSYTSNTGLLKMTCLVKDKQAMDINLIKVIRCQ